MYTEIYDLIRNYESGANYVPLEITFEVIPLVFITSPWLHFDSLITYLCLRDALGDLFYALPSKSTINIDELKTPLKKTEGVPHASVGIFDKAKLFKNTIYKRFTDKEIHHLSDKARKGRIKTNQGYFKDFMIDLPIIMCNKITFYCCGDKKELQRLLPHLKRIGKKTSIGGGRIKNISIKDADADYSFFKNDKVMRPVPASWNLPLCEGMNFQRQPYKPPYWDKNNVVMCYCPESQISVGR